MSLYSGYPDSEPINTRPMLELPEWDGCEAGWVQNITITEVAYWAARNELPAHIFRKRHAVRWWRVSVVVLGEPQPTEACTVAELVSRDVLGVYAWRRGWGMTRFFWTVVMRVTEWLDGVLWWAYPLWRPIWEHARRRQR